MKPTKKTSIKSSDKVKEKVRLLANKKRTKAPSSTSSQATPEAIEPSTPTIQTELKPKNGPDQPSQDGKVHEGVIQLDNLPFHEQARILFDPLSGINKKSIIGKPQSANDPFAPRLPVLAK